VGDKSLDLQYAEWRAKEIAAGRISKQPLAPYDPTKKYVPPILESERVTLGKSLPELEAELSQFKAARASGRPIDPNRLTTIHREAERLRLEQYDIGWSAAKQAEQEAFARGPIGIKPKSSIIKNILRHKKAIVIGGGLAIAGANILLSRRSMRSKLTNIDITEALNGNIIEGVHPGSQGMGAENVRRHSEFGSGWDPLRRIAKEVFHDIPSDVAFKKLTTSKEFREAVRTGLEAGGKQIGRGAQGEVWAYKAAMSLGGKTSEFEFAVKKGTPINPFMDPSSIAYQQERLSKVLGTEAKALETLGAERTPSFYGHGQEFGMTEEAIVMEKFQLGTPLAKFEEQQMSGVSGFTTSKLTQENPLTAREVSDLESFMKSAHKRGITHTDLHQDNVVRAINPLTGGEEVAVLDWGLANRFQQNYGVGGVESMVSATQGVKRVRQQVAQAIGRPVGIQEYSEAADILRVRSHQFASSESRRSSKLAVNAIYDYNMKVRDLRSAEQELAAAVGAPNVTQNYLREYQHMVQQRMASVKEGEALLSEVSEGIADYLSGGVSHGKSSTMTDVLTAIERNVPNINIIHKANTASDMAYAKTLSASWMGDTVQAQGRSVLTAIDRQGKRQAIRRNAKFRDLSQKSVGIGLRSFANGNKGHVSFGSTGSTTVL
jgi:serine/threonine protein kinase